MSDFSAENVVGNLQSEGLPWTVADDEDYSLRRDLNVLRQRIKW